MAQLASADITLTAVSDACSVVLSPSSCSIHADYDGSNPILTYAYTDINVVRGDVKLAIDASNITINGTSNQGITTQLQTIDTYTQRLKITAIPTTILSGNVEFTVTIGGFSISSTFPFNVVRESSMLAWIQDWETRKTQIGGEYVITPKIFAGQKDATTGELTGVYIGPDTLGAGIYGYKEGETVFRINANGAYIGGWNIETGGIMTADMKLQLLSEGTIKAIDTEDNNAIVYALYKSGEASFAKGNVLFHADGSASFTGTITAANGSIAGWQIVSNAIHSNNIVLNSVSAGLYIINTTNYENTANSYIASIKQYGGLRAFYTNAQSFGLDAWLPAITTVDENTEEVTTTYRKAFSLGSEWSIAGWNFDHQRFYNANAVLVGASGYGGLFLSPDDISGVAVSGLTANIQAASGIYLGASSSFVELAGYSSGNLVFRLGTAGNQIGGWSFDNVKLWYGSTVTDAAGFTANANSMIFGQGNIVGHKWRLSSDGSGSLAAGKITWSYDSANSVWNLDIDGVLSADTVTVNSVTSNVLVLSKTILVKNGSTINAGMSGDGTASTSIRFWAGNTYESRASAPFRVTQAGELYSTSGNIGGWVIDTNQLRYGLTTSNNYILLDPINRAITLRTTYSGYEDYSIFSSSGAILKMDSSTGLVSAQLPSSLSYSTGIAYISPSGVFANLAGIDAVPASSGWQHRGAVVGLGFANVNKSTWSLNNDENIIAGVYGRASNSGTAPAFGGYFQNLRACGFSLSTLIISDSSNSTTQISSTVSYVIGLPNSGNTRTVYLPNDNVEGKVVWLKQMGAGTMRVATSGGQWLHREDVTNLSYYDLVQGDALMAVLTRYAVNGTANYVWVIEKI